MSNIPLGPGQIASRVWVSGTRSLTTLNGQYNFLAYTSSDTFVNPFTSSGIVWVTVVGGGGGGGSATGNTGVGEGGGAGMVITKQPVTVSGNVTVTIGGGGASVTAGSDSSFGSLTATGGFAGTENTVGSFVNAVSPRSAYTVNGLPLRGGDGGRARGLGGRGAVTSDTVGGAAVANTGDGGGGGWAAATTDRAGGAGGSGYCLVEWWD